MNAPGAGGLLTRFGVLDIEAKLTAILGDDEASARVDVLVTTAQVFDPAAGTTTPTTLTSPLSGFLGPLETRAAVDPYQVGDVVLNIPARLVAGTLDAATSWTVQPTGEVYLVITTTLDALGLHWQLVGRRST